MDLSFSSSPDWTKLINAPEDQRVGAILEYCQAFIDQKDEGAKSAEEAGYEICGIHGLEFKNLPEDVIAMIDAACELEIGRDTKAFFGEGVWTEEEADAKKENQWDNFLALFEQLRENYLTQ